MTCENFRSFSIKDAEGIYIAGNDRVKRKEIRRLP